MDRLWNIRTAPFFQKSLTSSTCTMLLKVWENTQHFWKVEWKKKVLRRNVMLTVGWLNGQNVLWKHASGLKKNKPSISFVQSSYLNPSTALKIVQLNRMQSYLNWNTISSGIQDEEQTQNLSGYGICSDLKTVSICIFNANLWYPE